MRKWPTLVAALLFCCPAPARADSLDNLVVIVNKSNKLDALSESKIRLIFLRKVSRWPWGAEIYPVDLPDHSRLRRSFAETLLNQSVERLGVYWIDQKVTRNVDRPSQVDSPAAAKELVASKAGAIGYVPKSFVDDTVKVLEVR